MTVVDSPLLKEAFSEKLDKLQGNCNIKCLSSATVDTRSRCTVFNYSITVVAISERLRLQLGTR
jgi:hypothetical protein